MRHMIRHAGTLLPLLFIMLFGIAAYAASDGDFTWMRPITYAATVVCLILGLHALLAMAKASFNRHPTIFLLMLIYQKAGLLLIFIAIFFAAINLLVPNTTEWVPQWLIWALLVSSAGMMCIYNLILFFGRKRNWLTRQTHILPLAAFFDNHKDKDNV